MEANPRYQIFLAELKKLTRPFRRWQGIIFRASPLQYARVAKLLDGRGSFEHGGRWCAAGCFPANNLSTTAETAIAESGAIFRHYGFDPATVRPRVLVAVRIRVSKVLDLCAPQGLRARHWMDLHDMLAEDWRKMNDRGRESLSQVFGRAAHDVGAEALLVPSARVPTGRNLVYFPESLRPGSKIEIMGESELNRWL